MIRLFAAALVFVASLSAQPRRNVILIVTDDLNNDFSVYGHPQVRSPNLERLAARGVTFERAYCQAPICNPSRSSFLTGLYPDQTGVLENGDRFREHIPDVVTLPQLFRQAGYFVARVGKIFHYGVPSQIGTPGVDDPVSWDETVNPIGRDKFDEYLIRTIGRPGEFGGTLSWLAADGRDSEQTDAIGVDATIELLERRRSEPFFIAMGFYRPHTPYVAPRKYFAMYPLSRIRLPVEPPGDLLDIPAAAWVARPRQDMMSETTKREAIQAYYAAVTFLDSELGRLLDVLDALDLWENTVVVFVSDHGYHLGEHRLWQKTTLFENSARVPLLIAAPDFDRTRGQKTAAVTELVDLYPTLTDLCGLEPPAHLMGATLRPQLDNASAPGKSAAFTTYVSHDRLHQRHPQRPTARGYTIRTKRWRYTEWGRDAWQGVELYDHRNDPGEFVNLARDPERLSTVEMLSRLLTDRVERARSAPQID